MCSISLKLDYKGLYYGFRDAILSRLHQAHCASCGILYYPCLVSCLSAAYGWVRNETEGSGMFMWNVIIVYVYVLVLSAAYGWVRETPEGSGVYIQQETITAEEGETIQLTIFYTKNADLILDVFLFNIDTAGTARRM